MTMRLPLARLALAVGGLLVLALLGEIATRVYYQARYGIPFSAPAVDVVAYPMGWDGRRVWGDPRSPRPKLLVLGDSMTAGVGVREEALYPVVLGRRLNAEVFMLGGGGYGTLQESMALEQALGSVHPDLVVLQVTSNDFINNTWTLESSSYFNSNLRVRPYLEGDRVVYRFPFRSPLVEPLVTRSRLAFFMMPPLTLVGAVAAAVGVLPNAEARIEGGGLAFPAFRASVDTTERIVAAMRDRVRLVAFAADDPQPYLETWRQICERQRVPFFDGVPAAVASEERRLGTSIRLDGAHWNALGHRVVGETLARWLADRDPPRL